MNKKVLFYILSIVIGLVLVISTCIVITEKLRSDNAAMNVQLEKYREEINILEDRINEYRHSETHYGDYQGNDDFSDIINDNPIDKDYRIELAEYQEKPKTTTLEWGALKAKYIGKWQEEVDAALEYLYKSLSEQDSLNLKQSQKSWQKFIDDDLNFVNHKFIDTGYLGTQGNVKTLTVELHRTRDRAIELMEYVFMLDRTAVDFVYDN
ncbi:MAG: DUF1311 domain-containing protein [Clostridia bacterium]|nr:DUF1311 domain-containing protein [Clostridia bacterium]